jgi:hypothetical protein
MHPNASNPDMDLDMKPLAGGPVFMMDDELFLIPLFRFKTRKKHLFGSVVLREFRR